MPPLAELTKNGITKETHNPTYSAPSSLLERHVFDHRTPGHHLFVSYIVLARNAG